MEELSVIRDIAPALDCSNGGCNDDPKSTPKKSRVDKQEINPDVALARAKYSSEHEVLVESVGDPKHSQNQDSPSAGGTPPQSEGHGDEERDWNWLNHMDILYRAGRVSKRSSVRDRHKCFGAGPLQ